MNNSISGQCHCGSVKWTATLPHKIALNCHCNMCRSLSGADYSSWIVIPSDQFSVISGGEDLTEYQASAAFTKSFCKKCGSTVNCINNDKFPDHTYVAKGNISTDFDIPAEIQVFTNFKASWVNIDESIPVFN
ncbi:MAG: GFA family protein [Oceanicoccus sp.]